MSSPGSSGETLKVGPVLFSFIPSPTLYTIIPHALCTFHKDGVNGVEIRSFFFCSPLATSYFTRPSFLRLHISLVGAHSRSLTSMSSQCKSEWLLGLSPWLFQNTKYFLIMKRLVETVLCFLNSFHLVSKILLLSS